MCHFCFSTADRLIAGNCETLMEECICYQHTAVTKDSETKTASDHWCQLETNLWIHETPELHGRQPQDWSSCWRHWEVSLRRLPPPLPQSPLHSPRHQCSTCIMIRQYVSFSHLLTSCPVLNAPTTPCYLNFVPLCPVLKKQCYSFFR